MPRVIEDPADFTIVAENIHDWCLFESDRWIRCGRRDKDCTDVCGERGDYGT